MGFDWPASSYLLVAIIALLGCILWLHGKSLLANTQKSVAWKLISLRLVSVLLFLLLIARPFVDQNRLDKSKFKLSALVDLSGSMDIRDDVKSDKRIDLVSSHLVDANHDSWIGEQRNKYGEVEVFGFSENRKRFVSGDLEIPSFGGKTALGDAMSDCLIDEIDDDHFTLGSVVVFSDGRNNQGKSILEVGKEFRDRGIPINVVGVGEKRPTGDLSVQFTERNPKAVAKEELLLQAKVTNQFEAKVNAKMKLFLNDQVLQEMEVSLNALDSKTISFNPLIPKTAGNRRYRVEVTSPAADVLPSNNMDSLLVEVKPPVQFSILYVSNQPRVLYPFIKRALSDKELFSFSSIIRLGEKVFHAFGDDLKPDYPTEPEFWMKYDAIILDTDSLDELNASVRASLKDFVQKRGGGLAMFGALEEARENLGGLVPVREVERVVLKQNLSLRTNEDPLFGPEDQVDEMNHFLPNRLPGFLVARKNPASRGVVMVKSTGQAVLAIQAYGAGKVAYWGSPHDWRRALIDEDGNREFERFWQALCQWLGAGGEERMKVSDADSRIDRGAEANLSVDALGSDFEPAMDALVEAEVKAPDGSLQKVQLYPRGSVAGQYAGNFRPGEAGVYEINYKLRFPNGEELEKSSYLRVARSGMEAKDTSFAERDLRMLAKLTGGNYLHISELNADWEPKFADNLPTLNHRKNLSDAWPIFIALFLAAGMEWITRRQIGLR